MGDARPGPLLPRGAVTATERGALAVRAVAVIRPAVARFRLTGGGRVECLQGLVTCDVAGDTGPGRLLGALLTAKGMVVAPLWITRLPDAIDVEVPADAAAQVGAVFQRSLPPRLCRSADVTAEWASLGLYGPAADAVLQAAGTTPPAGTGAAADASGTVVLARAADGGVAGIVCDVPAGEAPAFAQRLVAAGATAASPALLEERRILSGFPRMGAEIDARTLPQEVRLDELGAVSFTKGCYLGQETVARVHFRGHATRRLAGLALERGPAALPLDVLGRDGAVAGRLTSACWWEAGGGWVGLAIVRRALEDGRRVELAGGGAAILHRLPWEDASPAATGGAAP